MNKLRRLIRIGRSIKAIKYVRDIVGYEDLTLKEGLRFVEKYGG